MRIIHVFRGVVGGLFRHVVDQANGQIAQGHQLGIFCDSLTGGESGTAALSRLPLPLGLRRAAIGQMPSPSDLANINALARFALESRADILHGHGAKGGLYARLTARKLGLASVYTPHGGSLHYEWASPLGAAFLTAEKALRVKKSGFTFVCEFERETFARKVGLGSRPNTVVYNGLGETDFLPRKLAPEAADFLYVGEMRAIKGPDLLLRALALVPKASLAMVGDGKETNDYIRLAQELGLADRVKFLGRLSMSKAMPLGKTLVVPSRRESFPYVVIEALAAGLPVIASRVGGIPEALPEDLLFASDDPQSLAQKMREVLSKPQLYKELASALRKDAKAGFSTKRMVSDTLAFYEQVISRA